MPGLLAAASTIGPSPIEAVRGHRIVAAYLPAFVGRRLSGEPAALLDGPSPVYPEVQIATRRP